MKKIIWAAVALLGFAAWADFNTALDCNGLTFTTGGDANWFEQTDDVKFGESTLRSGAIKSNDDTWEESWLETTVTNTGTLSFWWKVSSESGCDVLSVYVDGKRKAEISGDDAGWIQKSISVIAGQMVCWKYSKDDSVDRGEDCGWLDGILFTPATESITVTFVTNGGEAITPTNVTPGITYGELPVPQKEGLDEFGGWYLDEGLTEKAYDDDPVVFHDVTLYAKWRIPVSVLDIDGAVAFSTYDDEEEGHAPWEAIEDAEADGGYALCGPKETDGARGYLYADVTGMGTLSFEWNVDGKRGASAYFGWDDYDEDMGEWEECVFADDPIYPSQEWRTSSIVYYDSNSVHRLRWYSSGTDAAICIRNVRWTPAPESMTISFVTGIDGWLTSTNVVPGTMYRALPKPEREGLIFAGWYRDEAMTTRVADYGRVSLEDHALYAKWIRPVSLLDQDGIVAFSSDDEHGIYTPWEAVEDAEAEGGYALRGPKETDGAMGYLYADVTGMGTLSFKWNVTGDGDAYFNVSEYGRIVRTRTRRYRDPETGEWRTEKISYQTWDTIFGDEGEEFQAADEWRELSIQFSNTNPVHQVRWYSEGENTAVVLRDFVWTPAPESMAIVFETNGGEAIAPTNVVPGVLYGDLPKPEHPGREFVGWYLDEGWTKQAADSEYVAFRDHTLYAKWRIPVSVLDIEGVVEFSTDEEYYEDYIILPWEAVEDAEADRGYVLRGPGSESYLYAKVTGLGTLSFRWRVTGDAKSGWQRFQIGELYEYYDEVGDEYYEDWNLISDFGNVSFRSSAKWQDFSIVCTAPTNKIEFCAYGRDAAVNIRDFVWTPAPEKMTVSFDTTGGGEIAPRDFAPGDTYGELPVPTFGEWTFLGWYENDLTGKKVESGALVPFRENITLVAKWGKPANTFAADGLDGFTASGEVDMWWNVYTPNQGMLEVEPQGVVDSPEWGRWCEGTSSRIQATTTAEGYMQFRFSLKNGGRLADGGYSGNGPYASIAVCLDDQKVTDAEVWGFDDETGEQQVRVFVPAGEHVLSWNVEGRRAYSYTGGYWDWDDESDDEFFVDAVEEFGSAPVVRVWGFDFEPAGPQESLQKWSGKVRDYKSWRTGDLARFAAEYKARMENDANDYEARILYAVTRLGALAEDRQFTDYAKTFGLTVDWARLSVTPPRPTFGEDSAAINAMVDKTIELAEPVIADVQAALAGIPEDWTGSVTLNADEWPIDETVAIDVADVLFARAGLDAALAGLDYLGAYDLTVDWTKVDETVNLSPNAIPVLDAIPEDDEDWGSARSFRAVAHDEMTGTDARIAGAFAISGSTLALRLDLPYEAGWLNETNQVGFFDFYFGSGDVKLNVWGKIYGEDGLGWTCGTETNVLCHAWIYGSETNVPASIEICGNEMLLGVDMSDVNGFGARTWTIRKGEVSIRAWRTPSEWIQTGCITWSAQSAAERRLLKFAEDQTAFFGKVRDAERLAASRSLFTAALERALAADGKATARADDDVMHFFEYDPEDSALISFARANTQRALASLKAPTAIDFAQVAADLDATGVATNKFRAADYNFTLLPDEGVTRIYLGALLEGGITRDLLPPMHENDYGEIVPNLHFLPDPTFGGLIPDMTATNMVRIMAETFPNREFDDFLGYRLYLDVNGGSVEVNELNFMNGVVLGGMPLDPIRAGYEFGGWLVNGQPLTSETLKTDEDITAIAQWTPNTYTVSFDANGGEGEMADASWTYDMATNLAAVGFTRVGHTFAGWATDATGEVVFADGASASNLTAVADGTVTLYAAWTPNEYTVNFLDRGDEVASITQDYGTEVTAPADPVRSGYTFAGWTPAVPATVPAEDVTCVAQWTANGYSVAFDANGGEGEMADASWTYDAATNLAAVGFTRVGHTFVGWATNATGEVVFAAGSSVSNLTAVAGGAVTLYAAWTPNTYTVTFDANGGEGEMADQTFTYGVAAPLAASTFRMDGCRFFGWSTEPDGNVVFADGEAVSNLTAVVDGSVTLYAQWMPWDVAFVDDDLAVGEGSNAVVRILGGNPDRASSVKVYLVYNTATATDVDLKTGAVRRVGDAAPYQTNLKFPLTLNWAKGEIGEKAISIPIKKDALVEGEELFTLQFAAASGVELGGQTVCTVRIADAQWPDGMTPEEAAAQGLASLPAGATAVKDAAGTLTGYFTKKDKKGKVTAKAMPGYIFTGWYDAKGKLVSSKAALADKTRKSKKATPRFAVAHYLRGLADPANGGKVTGSGLYAAGKKVILKATPNKKWTFEGWYDADGAFASKSKSLTVSVTNELTYLATFKPYPKVTVAVDNAKGGAVKGAGSYLAGKTVTLTATPKKGYAFCGWFDADGNLVSLNASYKYKVTADGLALSASFKKEGALAKPALTWDATNLTVGVSYSAKLSVVGESLVSVTKVTGLPKGLTFKSGKVSGVPTVAKAVTAKVTVALKSNAKKTWTYSVKLNVAALPTWAVGTFKGTLYDGEGEGAASKGTVTLTVGKTGKVSGKFIDTKKKSYSFSVASFKTYGEDGVLRTQATMKYGTKTCKVEISVGQDSETSVGLAEVGSTAAPFSGIAARLAK